MALRGRDTNYLRAGGVLMIAQIIAGKIGPYRDLGDHQDIQVAQEIENADIIENRSGSFAVAQRDKTSETYTISAALRDITMETFALAFGAEREVRSVAATQVEDEVLYRAVDGGIYPLGAGVTSNIEGVLQIATVDEVNINAAARVNSTPYAVGDVVTDSGNAYVYTVAGTSASSPPTFPTSGGTVADGSTAILKHLGPVALVVDDDYIVTLEPAKIQINADGDFATSMSRMPSGYTLDLAVTYTPVAATQWRLRARSAEAEYFVRFEGATEKGAPVSFVARYCSVQGGGDIALVNPDEPMTVSIEITPTSPDGGLAMQWLQKPVAEFTA